MDILNICVSDIPKNAIKTSPKNGKSYMTICVSDLKEKDQFDNTKTVFMGQTKDEREQKTPKIYIGNGKTVEFGQSNKVTAEEINEMPPAATDDLPFQRMNENQKVVYQKISDIIERKKQLKKLPYHCLFIADLNGNSSDKKTINELINLKLIRWGNTINDIYFILL